MSWSQRYPQINNADVQQRLAKLINIGTVAEADYENARVKVTIGEWTTTWLPWITTRASNDLSWWALEVGEQVMVLSPSGDIAQGVVLGSIFQQSQQSEVNAIQGTPSQNIHRIKYQDGTVIEYDRENHLLKADVKGDVHLLVESNLTAEVTGNADVNVEGNLTAAVSQDATISADNITLDAAGDMTLRAGGNMKLNAAHISAQE